MKNKGENRFVISDEVIASIAVQSIKNIDGINGFAEKPKSIRNIFGSTGNLKYVNIVSSGNISEIDIYVKALYNFSLPDICKKAQTAVKNAVESMTDKKVSSVNINVMSIDFDAEPIKSK